MIHGKKSLGKTQTLCALKNPHIAVRSLFLWEHTDSNRGPSACKADALNRLSYAPFRLGVQI